MPHFVLISGTKQTLIHTQAMELWVKQYILYWIHSSTTRFVSKLQNPHDRYAADIFSCIDSNSNDFNLYFMSLQSYIVTVL